MTKRPPDRPEDIHQELSQDLAGELGTDLLGLCLYGSAAAGRYVKGRSDLNLLILVADHTSRVVSRLMPFYKKWAPAGLAPPLILTPSYLAGSLDAFPIEFLVMAASHQCIFGRDPLEGLNLERGLLRLQLEREIKGKLTALRSRLLSSGGEPKALKGLADQALPAFTAYFQTWLHLTSGGFPNDPEQVLLRVREAGLEVDAFVKLNRLRRGEYRPRDRELMGLWEEAVQELETICRQVDGLAV